MNKKQAKTEAENNTRTWGELLEIVENADISGMAKINPGLTRAQAAEIFKNMIAERDLNEIPNGLKYDVCKNRHTMSRDGLGIQNILREFA